MVENSIFDDENEVFEEESDFLETEEETLEEGEKTQADTIKKLRKKLAECEADKKAHLDDLQRVRADFLNSKRRLEEQFARDKERATDKLLIELISLIDSFDTAMVDKQLWEAIDERWRRGIEAIHTNLISILKSNNVVTLDPLGEMFNPEEHEAVANIEVTDDAQVDTITAVLQKGFKRNDNIIRHAKVVVGTI